MKVPGKILAAAIVLIALSGAGYYYKDTLKSALHLTKHCEQPITYSIGTFDTEFGLSEEQFLKIVAEAKKPWEDAEGKTLFTYDPKGTMKINLIYDYRQQATNQLSEVGGAISNDQAKYDALKKQYDELNASYTTQKKKYENDVASYNKESDAYEQKVTYYNNRGGAPEDEYNALAQQKKDLDAQAAAIDAEQKTLNKTINSLNETANTLNEVAVRLNLKVKNYNSIGQATGEEFSEGEYVQDNSGMHIDIYQFDNEDKLKRVLIHELGHALGLNHVADPDAIMYRLNSSTNEKLTADDLAELKRVCSSN